jgi:ankyrin repeat protein
VELRLVIGIDGRVRSAVAPSRQDQDVVQFVPAALDAAKALRYRPILRHGIAVEAEAEEHVFILPPEKTPTAHVAFPAVADLSQVSFTLKRTSCFGSCPAYDVRIAGDGTVTFLGGSSVAVVGSHVGRVALNDVRGLLDLFRRADFYSFDDKYSMNVTDGPTFVIGIEVGGVAKSITDYMGEYIGMPLAITALEAELDRTAGTAKWLKGNSETVPSLRAEGFDFKSDAAGMILTRVAASGDEAVVLDLINAGAPIGIVDMGSTALANAAGSGKHDAVDLLIKRGADAKNPRVLMEAVRSGSASIVRRILDAGGDAKADLPGIRFLIFEAASTHGRKAGDADQGQVVRILVKAGADPEMRDADENTALHGDLDPRAAQALVELGANVNARNKRGETPLMWASDPAVAEILLKAGADVSLRNNEGKTALDLARERHFDEMAAVLEKAPKK